MISRYFKIFQDNFQSWIVLKWLFMRSLLVVKWDYLLRNCQFTILTDHQNLTPFRAYHDSNKMVKRWFMAYQEYDILAWELTIWFPTSWQDVHPASSLFQLTGYEIPEKHWDSIEIFHNSGLKGDGPGGYGGVERTLRQLDEAGLQWPHRPKHDSYPFTVSTYGLWNTVSVDYTERLVPDKYGNNMIVVIIDNFSRCTDI
jgi:hypothetical protein